MTELVELMELVNLSNHRIGPSGMVKLVELSNRRMVDRMVEPWKTWSWWRTVVESSNRRMGGGVEWKSWWSVELSN